MDYDLARKTGSHLLGFCFLGQESFFLQNCSSVQGAKAEGVVNKFSLTVHLDLFSVIFTLYHYSKPLHTTNWKKIFGSLFPSIMVFRKSKQQISQRLIGEG